MVLTKKQLNNFWSKVQKSDSCWNWIAYTNKSGYGMFKVDNQMCYAHRISAFISGFDVSIHKNEKGSLGKIIMHICDNPSCVNPKHLKVGNQKENMQDAKKKGRARKHSGEFNNKAKLSWEDVGLIRSPLFTIEDFRSHFNLNDSQFYRIKSNKHWVI